MSITMLFIKQFYMLDRCKLGYMTNNYSNLTAASPPPASQESVVYSHSPSWGILTFVIIRWVLRQRVDNSFFSERDKKQFTTRMCNLDQLFVFLCVFKCLMCFTNKKKSCEISLSLSFSFCCNPLQSHRHLFLGRSYCSSRCRVAMEICLRVPQGQCESWRSSA